MKTGALTIIFLVLLTGLFIYSFAPIQAFTGLASTERCSDSDSVNGLSDIFRSGVTTERFSRASYHDSCVRDNLVEAYCDSQGRQRKASVKCENGCSAGKCRKFYCRDSDGRSARLKGTAMGYYHGDFDLLGIPPNMQNKNYTDWCYSKDEVVEYYCVGGEVKEEITRCYPRLGYGSMCLDGKCVSA